MAVSYYGGVCSPKIKVLFSRTLPRTCDFVFFGFLSQMTGVVGVLLMKLGVGLHVQWMTVHHSSRWMLLLPPFIFILPNVFAT